MKQVPKNDEIIDKYLANLVKEIYSYKEHFKTIETIYIGGGTPSMLKVYQLEFLLDALKDIDPIEFTIEVNPESYTNAKGSIFAVYGINRVSLGVQSFNQDILTFINRKHNKEQVFYAVKDLKEQGITNISIDLIYAIPNQTMDILYQDLEYIKELDIMHISCYSLILEDKTYFYHQFLKGNYKPVSNDLEGNMFEVVMEELKKQGFEHYEISNFAKNKKYSLHNKLYWTLGEYIGVGLGAHGFIDNHRTYNHKSINKYNDNPLALKDKQSIDDMIQDSLIFGLRLIDGIDIKALESKFNFKLLDRYPEIQNKIDQGLVEIAKDKLKLTKKGIFLGNMVFEVFV